MSTKEEVCMLLDKLTLEMLHLMEQEVQCKINIEKTTKDASVELARARYVKGQQTVSVLQLPTEKSTEFDALSVVTQDDDESEDLSDKVDLRTRPADKEKGEIDPLKWFGVLVPQSLQRAQKLFKQSLEYVVECRNVQGQLHSAIEGLFALNALKKTL
ncbi:coiled-coil domain-containing protein 115 [Ctenocephalides felis]|uniref:coiled-coil domain-containing protein 115 n=1 Tax=Ctenocephalides felis TaxID=7515 RepID=UPI000E6E465B|nr:coiled-coil domain-containing protein 115 [Ctenocephalides felis]